jgi:formate dehydrogenase subunit beta
MIPTQNDPLGTVRAIILSIWEATNLERILLPLNGNSQITGPNIVTSAAQIENFNPFTPLMPINATQLIPKLTDNPKKVGAVLRPCEMRTLQSLAKYDRLFTENLLTISIDCLGTLPADEFEWRAQRKGSPKGLTQEALKFARLGGIVPYRYRAACQICESPEATKADINIGIIGLPVRESLMIQIKDDELAKSLHLETMIPVNDAQTSHHRSTIDRIVERGKETRSRIFTGLSEILPTNIDSLIDQMHDCGDCRTCLETCPISTSDFPRQDEDGFFIRNDILEWLVSCSECGICEQDCPRHLPLTIIFSFVRSQLAANIR